MEKILLNYKAPDRSTIYPDIEGDGVWIEAHIHGRRVSIRLSKEIVRLAAVGAGYIVLEREVLCAPRRRQAP